jgi:hypothetical protein
MKVECESCGLMINIEQAIDHKGWDGIYYKYLCEACFDILTMEE